MNNINYFRPPSASISINDPFIISSFKEMNRAIREKLHEFNEKLFQKKKGSRITAFEEEEKNFLMPLPASPYETDVICIIRRGYPHLNCQSFVESFLVRIGQFYMTYSK